MQADYVIMMLGYVGVVLIIQRLFRAWVERAAKRTSQNERRVIHHEEERKG